MNDARKGRVVVGVDGSVASEAALRWALEDSRRRGAALQVVHAWTYPAAAMRAYGGTALPAVAAEDVEEAARGIVDATVARVVGDADDVPLTVAVARGHPAEVLMQAANDADLVVVGSRGDGGFKGMLLGSVTGHVVHSAPCPVVVVKPPAPEGSPRRRGAAGVSLAGGAQ